MLIYLHILSHHNRPLLLTHLSLAMRPLQATASATSARLAGAARGAERRTPSASATGATGGPGGPVAGSIPEESYILYPRSPKTIF